jgi:hypothetical protein
VDEGFGLKEDVEPAFEQPEVEVDADGPFGDKIRPSAAAAEEIERDEDGRVVAGPSYTVSVEYERLPLVISATEALKRLKLSSVVTTPLSEIVALRERAGLSL